MGSAANIQAYPPESGQIALKDGEAPRFWVTIDTEEDFDWNGPFSRTDFRLDSVPALSACQSYFERAGVRPIYLIDWPIVQDDRAVAILAPALASGRCDIGAQLHPWVTPPFDEAVNDRNSYTGNLPETLQRAKMQTLRDGIRDRFGTAPLAYRAGRYGLGRSSAAMLADLGFRLDTSVRSGFDYRPGHGPDYRCAPLRAALARLGLVERIALTPEGIPADKACRAIDIAIEQSLPILNFSFHSPSLQPGNTPYVRSDADLDLFYRWWDVVLDHLARRGIAAIDTDGILAMATRSAIAR